MTLPRCPHDVYSPDGDGKPCYACSGCFVPDPPLENFKQIEEEWNQRLEDLNL
jgi:hypothetical protein